jgi:proton-dependent oligopeptide transporter, POT family
MQLYEELFIFSAQIGIAMAVVFFAISPLVKKLMHQQAAA